MKINKEKQSLVPANSKITRIEQYLESIHKQMNTLAEELEAWKQQKKEWDDSSNTYLSTIQHKIKNEIKAIENQLVKRQSYCEQYILKINIKLGSLQTINKQSRQKVDDLQRRIENIEQILGVK